MKPLHQLRDEKHLKEQYAAVVDRFAGPVPAADFIDECMPMDDIEKPRRINFAKVAKAKTHEAACRALMQAGGHLCPNYKFMHIEKRLNADIERGLRPSVACYPKHTSRIREAADDWKAIEMFVVMGEKGEEDPWCVNPNSEEAQTDALWKSRARSIMYARAQFAHQLRVFAFSLALYGQTARFLLWDRSGVLVSEAFDYVAKPLLLAQFLQRFSRLGVAERGWDATARPATFDEERTLTRAVEDYVEAVRRKEVPMLPDIHETLDRRYPCYKIRLDQEYCGKACEVLLRRPFVMPKPLVGRSTQGYIGYHLRERRLVFVKDYWTWDDEKKRVKEIDAYRLLAQQEIGRMPNVLYSGFVRAAEGADQSTPTAVYGTKARYAWGHEKKMKLRIHTRIVQDICYPLSFVTSCRHLVLAIRDALTAIQEAADRARLLHCDISSHNIMLGSDGRGILNDWDNGRFTNSPFKTPVGTWFFASILTVDGLIRRHTVLDDVEACFWVLIYQATRSFTYEALLPPGGEYLEITWILSKQAWKRKFLLEGAYGMLVFESEPLTDLVRQWRHMLAEHHNGTALMVDSREVLALFDDALRRTDWSDDFARHEITRSKSTGPLSAVEYLPGWSQAELDSLYRPCFFEVELARFPGLGEPVVSDADSSADLESMASDPPEVTSPRRKRTRTEDEDPPEPVLKKRRSH